MELMEQTREFKQTEAGTIPSDWQVSTIKDAFYISNNLRLPLSRTVRAEMQGPYPYYGPTRIQDYLNEFRVEGEYALIGEDGDHFLKYETMAMTQLATGRFNVNNHAHLIHGRKGLTSTRWFYYYFKHRDITPHLTRQGAGRFKLSKGSLEDVPCAFPPTQAEQKAIAEALSDADALIESLEQLIAKKRQIKQGAMQELLTGKRRLPGFEGEWVEKRLGDIAEVSSGGTPSRTNPSFWDGNIPWVTTTEIDGRMIRASAQQITKSGLDNSAAKLYPVGTLLMALYGQGKTRGKVGVLGIEAATNQACAAIEIRDDTYPEYVLLNLASRYNEIRDMSNIGNQENLNGQIVKSIVVPVPKPEEQSAISCLLLDMSREIEALKSKLSKYRQIKQGMMHNLLTGRIRLV